MDATQIEQRKATVLRQIAALDRMTRDQLREQWRTLLGSEPPPHTPDFEFNSLDAQREAAEAFIASQRAEGWIALPDRYDDGGFSGGTLERPALQRLMRDVECGKIDVVVVYKVDRLSRSLLDFTRIVDLFDRHKVSFVSVTQHFNTTSSMGRLTLNILLSFAQFEREIIGERIRDKVAAAKRKGKYTGGPAVLGYDVDRVNKRLLVNPTEAKLVRHIFKRFVQIQSTTLLAKELNEAGHRTKSWTTVKGKTRRGNPWDKFVLYRVLNNRLYIGEIDHKGSVYPGEHEAIIAREVWDQAHAIMAENSHSRGGRARSRTPALLRGIIKCGHCGCSMGITWSRRNGRQYRYYHCLSAAKSGPDTCPVKSVSAGDMEHAVIEQMRGLFRSPEIIAQTFRTAKDLATEGEQPFEETQVARAHRWAELLETGTVASLGELAAHVGVDPAYISRSLRLTLLAPDIIERILDGREPSGLSLAKLIRDVPSVWEEQRTKFGFPKTRS